MPSLFRPTTPDDEKPLAEFLRKVFQSGPDAVYLDGAVLRWKYWDRRDDYPDPRSFVIEKDGHIAAHAGLWPVTLRSDGGLIRGVSLIDWASDPQALGAGVSLLQRISRTFDFVYSIGGTAMTTAIMPKLGFQAIAEAKTWARPLRPWRQMMEQRRFDYRVPARLVRNVVWSRLPATAPHRGWSLVPADSAATAKLAAAGAERSEGFFRFLDQCPGARCRLFQILNGGKAAGCIEFAFAGKQARIAGLWLDRPSPDNWRIALELAQDFALRQTDACEIIARSADPAAALGAASAGMRLRDCRPVLLHSRTTGHQKLPLQFQLVDNDNVFLSEGAADFLT